MKFGVSVNRDEVATTDSMEQLDSAIERALTARDLGFDLLAFGHRYSIGPANVQNGRQPLTTTRLQPLPLIAHLSAIVGGDMAYATTVLVSPGLHPVQLAEDVATLDALCHGRLSVGVGLGWMPYESAAFGVDKSSQLDRYVELLEMYRLLLTSDAVTYQGRYFQADDVRLLARCVQRPMAPLWIGGSKDAAIARAARLGDAWVASGHIPLPDLERQAAVYRSERERLGLGEPSSFPIVRTVFVARTREEAIAAAEPALKAWYRKRAQWGWFLTEDREAELAAEPWRTGRWILGTPADCVTQIRELQERLGVTDIIFSHQGTGPVSDRASRLRSIRLIGEEVIPHFR